MAIFNTLIPRLQDRFAGRGLRLGAPPESSVTIPGVHPEFGDLEIVDEGHEVTLYVGRFTHGHFSCYEPDVPEQERADIISDQVIEFLEALFDDRVIVWGTHERGGGWTRRDRPAGSDSASSSGHSRRFLWSGPIDPPKVAQ
jgi:hypothetical protein